MKKYALMMNDKIDVIINRGNDEEVHTLYRIRALKQFGDVRKGELGGYIEHEGNLSQTGFSWVYDNSMVLENAQVGDHAKLRDNSMVYGNAVISGTAVISYNSRVFDNAHVYGLAYVMNDATVFGNANVSDETGIIDNAMVFGDASIHGHACIMDGAAVFGCSDISGNAVISGNSRVVDKFIAGDARINSTPEIYLKMKFE